MFYRVFQFIQAFFPRIEPSEIRWVQSNLSLEASALFLKQSPNEQRHALNVAQSLMNKKPILTNTDFEILLTAALLHDCGKSIVSIHLWQRVFIVLMQLMPPSIWSRLELSNTFLAYPLKIAGQHAQWGEQLAREAGLNLRVCLLIREHHSPETNLGQILAKADNTH